MHINPFGERPRRLTSVSGHIVVHPTWIIKTAAPKTSTQSLLTLTAPHPLRCTVILLC
jgi:hypothetical protein